MELLYFIDRKITSFLQSLAKNIEIKLKISFMIQRMFLMVLGIIIGSTIESVFLENGADYNANNIFGPFSSIAFIVLTILVWTVFSFALSMVLKQLHTFFDPDEAENSDKLYHDGYYSWGVITASIIFVIFRIIYIDSTLTSSFMEQGIGQGLYIGYLAFVSRRRGSGKKKKAVTSSALEKLLERCRDFLPQPIPAPNPVS